MSDEKEPTQQSRPQKWDAKRERWVDNPDVAPVEIPVPKRSAFDRLLHKVAHPKPADDTDEPAT